MDNCVWSPLYPHVRSRYECSTQSSYGSVDTDEYSITSAARRGVLLGLMFINIPVHLFMLCFPLSETPSVMTFQSRGNLCPLLIFYLSFALLLSIAQQNITSTPTAEFCICTGVSVFERSHTAYIMEYYTSIFFYTFS